ncbi:choline dehydrogenase, partial [Enterobacter hormaechei subsp. hoffmannii]
METCKADNQMQQTTLYFGLNRPAGAQITGNEWQQFVDQDVTPRFRDGLTVFDARGQWLGNDGKVAREPSKALMLIHGKDAQSEKNIEALRGIYKSRFAQESVMRVDQPVCVQF